MSNARNDQVSMVSDRDIWTTANSLIKQHGEDAVIHAAMRHDELLDQGDVDGVFVWKRVIKAVREFQAEEPPGAVH